MNDPALPGLACLQDQELFARQIRPHLTGIPAGATIAGLTVMKHRPGRRCTLRVLLSAGDDMVTVYAKAFAGERGTDLARLLTDLANLKKPGPLRVPAVLGYVAEARLLVLEEARGKLLPDVLKEGSRTADLVASALRRLHRPPRVSRRPWTYHEEFEVTRLRMDDLVRALPEARTRIAPLGERLEAFFQRMAPPATLADIHRDLYPANVVVEQSEAGGSVWLLDLDLVAAADPMIDVGNLVGEVALEALLQTGHIEGFDRWNDAFLAAYSETGDVPADGRLEIFRAVTLARNAGLNAATETLRWTCLPLLDAAERVLQKVPG